MNAKAPYKETSNTPLQANLTRKVKKERAPRKRDEWYLAKVAKEGEPGYEGIVAYIPLIGDVPQNDNTIHINEIHSKEEAIQQAKLIPDFLLVNEVVIISVSKPLKLTRTVHDKVSM